MRKALSQDLTGILASFPHLAPADIVVSSRIRVKRFGACAPPYSAGPAPVTVCPGLAGLNLTGFE